MKINGKQNNLQIHVIKLDNVMLTILGSIPSTVEQMGKIAGELLGPSSKNLFLESWHQSLGFHLSF